MSSSETRGVGTNAFGQQPPTKPRSPLEPAGSRYRELFVDPYDPNVQTPVWEALAAIPDAANKTVADLGCGTGPLLPYLTERFQRVIAVDFAPAMLGAAASRIGALGCTSVTFLKRPMHELDDLCGQLDVAVAINSLVMPDVRLIDQTLKSIRASVKPGGSFLGVVPSIDTIYYHLMLLTDQALAQGLEPKEARRLADHQMERRHYDFAFGEFHCEGLRQKFWQAFELEYRLNKAGFTSTTLAKVLYPWDDSVAGSEVLAGLPRNWDWFFHSYA